MDLNFHCCRGTAGDNLPPQNFVKVIGNDRLKGAAFIQPAILLAFSVRQDGDKKQRCGIVPTSAPCLLRVVGSCSPEYFEAVHQKLIFAADHICTIYCRHSACPVSPGGHTCGWEGFSMTAGIAGGWRRSHLLIVQRWLPVHQKQPLGKGGGVCFSALLSVRCPVILHYF